MKSLLNYLESNDWEINPDSDTFSASKGSLQICQMEDGEPNWRLTKYTATKAKLTEWEIDFSNAPDSIIIATIKVSI